MGRLTVVMVLVVSVLSGGSMAAVAAGTDLGELARKVAAAREQAEGLRSDGAELGRRMENMSSRLQAMHARLQAQQTQIDAMREQLARINVLASTVVGASTGVAGIAKAATVKAEVAKADLAKAGLEAAPDTASPSVPAGGADQGSPAGATATEVAVVATARPAVAASPAPGTSVTIASSASAVEAGPLSWLPGGLLVQTLLMIAALTILGCAAAMLFVRTRLKRQHKGAAAQTSARDAQLRQAVSRKAAENAASPRGASASRFQAADPDAAGQADETATMESESIPDAVASAVRDCDIYVAYGELEAARKALLTVLEQYPADPLLSRRLAELDGADAGDLELAFELEPLDEAEDTNVVPIDRARKSA